MIYLVLTLSLVLSHTSANATVFWEDDFENHLYPNWVGGGGCLTAGSPDGADCTYRAIGRRCGMR